MGSGTSREVLVHRLDGQYPWSIPPANRFVEGGGNGLAGSAHHDQACATTALGPAPSALLFVPAEHERLMSAEQGDAENSVICRGESMEAGDDPKGSGRCTNAPMVSR